MKSHKITISLIILLFILGFSGYAAAKDVSFSNESGEPGDSVIVSINVDNLSGLAGYNINFSYDTTVLTALYSCSIRFICGKCFGSEWTWNGESNHSRSHGFNEYWSR